MKYSLNFQKLKTTIGNKAKQKLSKKKMYMSDKNLPAQKENDDKIETTTKEYLSPKKNFRYSRINVTEEEDDTLGFNLIQKVLSLPLNFNGTSFDNEGPKNIDNDLLDDNKIDECEEDTKSADNSSEDSIEIPDKQVKLQKRNASEGHQVSLVILLMQQILAYKR